MFKPFRELLIMEKRTITYLLLFIGGTLSLFLSFYHDQWNVVEPEYYRLWERTYERVVIARLAKSQQDGIFSNAGLLGLAEAEESWNFDPDRQYEIYLKGEQVNGYRAYRSHPGFQGFVFSLIDRNTNFSPLLNIEIYRAIVSLNSAVVISLLATGMAMEFGWLPGILILAFSSISEWMILPGGNTYWNLWSFYLPFLAGIFFLEEEAKKNTHTASKMYFAIFAAILIKILFSGFEMITTTLIMATVPFVYYAILNKWGRVFWERMTHLGIVLSLATVSGLLVLSIQIAINDGNFTSSIDYISKTLERRAFGDPDDYKGPKAESLQTNDLSVIVTYLNINAFNSQDPSRIWQRPYWEIIVFFAVCTILFIARHRTLMLAGKIRKGIALIVATWYSLAAPLSWYVIFTATSYDHPFLFPMAWQMPFVLLGFALCGYVFQDLFKTKNIRNTFLPSQSSQTDSPLPQHQ